MYDEIIAIYPELTTLDFDPDFGCILLCDNGDGVQCIAKWDYSKPIPSGMKTCF